MQNEISLKYLTFSKKKRKKQGEQSLEEYIADFQIKAFKNVSIRVYMFYTCLFMLVHFNQVECKYNV